MKFKVELSRKLIVCQYADLIIEADTEEQADAIARSQYQHPESPIEWEDGDGSTEDFGVELVSAVTEEEPDADE